MFFALISFVLFVPFVALIKSDRIEDVVEFFDIEFGLREIGRRVGARHPERGNAR